MKKIIVPIDFSDNSINALEFAGELAKRTSSRLIILHILPVKEDDKESESKLNSARERLEKAHGNELKCETELMHGKLVPAMNKVIGSEKPDLIIMGTKGATGLKRILIGSNTVSVMAKTKVPMLVIPEAARFKNFSQKGKNKIVLATNLDEPENDNALDILKEISMMIIEPHVKVLNVRPKGTRLSEMGDLQRNRLLSFFNPEIESERITVFSENIIRGINYYLNKQDDIGLVAMIARDSGKIFQKHYTRAMASYTELPLLILHNKK